jgi:phosphate transport system permease protein
MALSTAKIGQRRAANVVFVSFCFFVTAIALVALTLILYSLVTNGIGGLNLKVFTMSTPAAGSPGGLLNAIVGSIMMCVLAMAMALLIGVMAGTWLSEYSGLSRYGDVIRFLNDVLLSAPSILVGVVVSEILVTHVIHRFSGIAGSVALALLAVPLITRTTEDVLRLQPTSLRESAIALGTPFWHVVRSVLWKAAASGIVTGALLAFARISGETAPLLLTALNNQFFSWNMTGPMANLPVVIFNFALGPYTDLNKLAWAGALLIAVTVLSVTIIARVVARESKQS